ncbi:39S ribosomal protein L18, mitochondrial [Condylostylus longicornis]|uniref:39S ribosomal protein L18, mitochondrial n=1 Tax=Condylostylus longicornis TaxID=2530218 RepID=UPI00244DAF1C|nr:39S ribosomal protein L18, mitochondrial [Condylostylus longicornis]
MASVAKKFQPLTSARVKHKIQELTKPEAGVVYAYNKNPRNLERLGYAYKPQGYHLEKPGRSYWHKLELIISQRYISAYIRHFQNGIVISASTKEWAIKKQLYKTNDTCAYINLGRVLADRCLKSGLTEMYCDHNTNSDGNTKLNKFIKILEENGIQLKEKDRFIPPEVWDHDYESLVKD